MTIEIDIWCALSTIAGLNEGGFTAFEIRGDLCGIYAVIGSTPSCACCDGRQHDPDDLSEGWSYPA